MIADIKSEICEGYAFLSRYDPPLVICCIKYEAKIDPMGDITCVMFSENPDVSRLSYNDLIKFRKILDSVCFPKNAQWKYVKFMTLKRLSKLKGENK